MSDGSIKISIEVDGKQIEIASKDMDAMSSVAKKLGTGLKSTESSVGGLGSSSAKASKDVKNASDSVENLADSGNKASKDLKNADNAIDGVADSSANATKDIKGTSDGIDDLADSGSKAGKDLKDVDSAIDGVADSSADAKKGIGDTSDSLDDLSSSANETKVDLKNVDTAVDDLADSTHEANKNVSDTSENLDKLSSTANDASNKIDGASGAVDDLGAKGGKAGSQIKDVDGAVEDLGNKSSKAQSDVKGLGDSVDGLGNDADHTTKSTDDLGKSTDDVGKKTSGATARIKELAVSIGLVAIASKAFDVLKSSLDDAIGRFDTLTGFPVVMERMGFSSEQAQKSISKLSDGIQGLPTTLNGIVASTQNIAILTGDLDNATDTALALNNAFLASGSSAADAERGLVQYVQMLSKGEVDLQSWRTLQETMGYAINKTAEAFGYAGKSAQNDFYEALKYGAVSFEEFNDKLIELNNGVGGFAEMASTGSAGIATSFSNLKNAVIVGAANMITSFNELSKEVTGNDIAKNLDGLKVVVGSTFKFIGSTIEGVAPVVKGFASAVQATTPIVQALSPAIIGLMSAYAAHAVITKVTAAVQASNAVLKTAMASTQVMTLLTQKQTLTQILSTNATLADIVAKRAQLSTIKLSSLAIGVMTGAVSLSTAAQVVATTATYALGAAVKFLMGPIGWITAGIGLLVAGTIAIVKWFKKATEEGTRLSSETEKLASSTDELSKATEESAAAHEKNQSKIETNAEAYAQLAAKAEEMASRDKLSGEEKKTLNSYIEELNRNVSGLNLVYGEESKALSASSEQILNRINLMKEEEKLQSAQERLTEIMKEQIDIQKQLEDVNALREEWSQKLEEGTVKSGEHKKALKELEEQETTLMEASKLAGEERIKVDQQIKESSAAVAAAAEKDTGRQLLMLDELSEAQQKTVENMKDTWESYKDSALDMFNTLSEKSEVSVGEMTKNLEENQRIITNWSENIAKLAERGVDEGLLNTLREAGPESAGHVNALVKASDSELEKLSIAFSKGGDVATKALSTSLGIENSGILESVGHLVMNTERALTESIAGAGFESIGGDVSKGLAQGIDAGSKEPANASKKMADDTTNAAKDSLGVRSPSRVFKEIGTNITEGLVLGIDGGSSKVVQAIQRMFKSVETNSTNSFKSITRGYDNAVKQIETTLAKLPQVTQKAMQNMTNMLKSGSQAQLTTMKSLSQKYDQSVKQIDKSLNKLSKVAQKAMSDMLNRLRSGGNAQLNTMRSLARSMPTPFNSLPGQMRSIGLNAMSGLNSGLNAGSGHVMSTARGIANRVASTMRQALKIHSPSRLMRDDVGKWIPEGIALGIEENAKSVYKALDNLSSGMILSSTPEAALGTSRMINNGASVGNVKATTNKDRGSDKGVIGLLREQNQILSELLQKNQDLYVDGEKMTEVVNSNNAIIAAMTKF